MAEYNHLEKYENILNSQNEILENLNKALDDLENKFGEFNELVDYYYSEQWSNDLEDDEQGLIPENINRGVLSEDGIYDMMTEQYSTCVRMIEICSKLLKR